MTGLVVDLFAGGGEAALEALGGGHDLVAVRARFVSYVAPAGIAADSCWEWQGFRQRRPGGTRSYGLFCVRKEQFLAHRMSWLLARGPIPAGLVVRHRCDNVACVRPDHLEVGTQADNLRDMRTRGRGYVNAFPKGTAHHGAKMDAEKVRRIRSLRRTGLSLAKIGAEVGLHASTVHDIVTGKTWGHVQ